MEAQKALMKPRSLPLGFDGRAAIAACICGAYVRRAHALTVPREHPRTRSTYSGGGRSRRQHGNPSSQTSCYRPKACGLVLEGLAAMIARVRHCPGKRGEN